MMRITPLAVQRRLRLSSLILAYSRSRPYLVKSWPVLAGGLASMVAESVLQLLRPWPLKIVLDNLLAGKVSGSPTSLPWLADLSPDRVLLLATVGILVIAGLGAIATYGERYLSAKAGELLVYRLRRDLYRHIQRLSLSFHEGARRGDLVLRLTADMSLIRNLLVPSMMTFVSRFTLMIGILFLILLIDRGLAFAALGIVPFLYLTTIRFSVKIKDAVRKQRKREGNLAATAAESVSSISLVKVHHAEEFESERFLTSHRKSYREGLKATRLQAGLDRSVEILMALGTCLVMWLGTKKALAHEISPGDLVLVLSYLAMIYGPIRSFSRLTGRIAKGLVAMDRIWEVFDMEPEELHAPGAQKPERIRGHICFRDVRFAYGDGPSVLRDVNIEILPGERVALVGRSGASKTTLVRLIPRLYEPVQGVITLDGIPLRDLELAYLRDQVSFVLQETLLLGISVFDNITYGRNDLTQEKVEEAARRARIHDRVLELPKGYQTILTEDGGSLSGGERQRIALARAFVRRTPIVILDEPDTYLDPVARRQFWEATAEVTASRTSICIVHDLEGVGFFDRVIVMDRGRVVGAGPHSDLLESCALYRELFFPYATNGIDRRVSYGSP